MDYFLHVLILICIYAIVGISLNLIAGYTGLLSIAHAAFYGIGGYTAALLSLGLGTNLLTNLPLAALITGLVGMMVAIPSIRIHSDYFVMTTFAFQMIVYSLMNNWIELTRGPSGLPGIPHAEIFSLHFDSPGKFLIVASLCAVFAYSLSRRLTSGPFGRVLRSIRDDEVLAQALGKDVNKFKIRVFVLGSAMVGCAGVLYVHYTTFVSPTSFTVLESIFMLSIVIVGGMGSLSGSIVGAVILVTLPELLRFVGLPSSVAANVRQIIYGGLLVIFMILRPQGLLGKSALGRRETT